MSTMKAKDYELVARGLDNLSCKLLEVGLYRRLVNDLAESLASQNPKFDKQRFYASCGITYHKELANS